MGVNNYTPLFSQIIDSSLWKEGVNVRVLFITMLASQDSDHVVRVPDHHLPGRANLSEKEVWEGLKVLKSADRKSLFPQPFDGRRIEKVDGGWLILNGEHYQEMMRKANKRAKWARNKRVQRARAAGRPLPGEAGYVEALKRGASEEELDRLSEPEEKI